MLDDSAVTENIRTVARMLAGYVERRTELGAELERELALAADSSGYPHERAANEAKALKSKIALYDAEIALLQNQLRRLTAEAGLVPAPVETTGDEAATIDAMTD